MTPALILRRGGFYFANGNKIIIDSKEFVDLLNGMLEEREMYPLVLSQSYDPSVDDDIPF